MFTVGGVEHFLAGGMSMSTVRKAWMNLKAHWGKSITEYGQNAGFLVGEGYKGDGDKVRPLCEDQIC